MRDSPSFLKGTGINRQLALKPNGINVIFLSNGFQFLINCFKFLFTWHRHQPQHSLVWLSLKLSSILVGCMREMKAKRRLVVSGPSALLKDKLRILGSAHSHQRI